MKDHLNNLTWIEKADYLRYLVIAEEGMRKRREEKVERRK
jgi:hypothetical protein